jgi:hypothetical protein
MPEEKKPHLPIGYWIKKADEALTTRINAAQQANGLSRTDWQILNTLHEGVATTHKALATLLRPFVGPDALRGAIEQLVTRGLVKGDEGADSGYQLTTDGQHVYEAALILQQEVRRQAVQGVDEADYATAVRVLQRLVENLTAGIAAR